MEYKNIEGFFKEAFEQQRMQPSGHVLRKIKFKLWLRDFFSLQPAKFNVAYTVVAASGIALGVLTINNNSDVIVTDEKENVSVIESIPVEEEKTIISAEPNATLKSETPVVSALASFVPSIQEGCAPLNIAFKNKSKKATSYHWDFGDGNQSTEKNPIHIYENSGRFIATLKIISEDGEETETDHDILVFDKPEANFEIDIQSSDIGRKEIVFNNKTKAAEKYIWSFGDEAISTDKNVTHTYSDYRKYEVKLVAENDLGCTDTVALENNFIEKNYELSFPLNFKPSTLASNSKGYYEAAEAGVSIFYPKNYGAEKYELNVYTPNGIKVFSTTDIKQGWNGFLKGRIAPPGFYTYEAKGIYPNGKEFYFKNKFKVLSNKGLDDYGY